jgi:mRNA interferase RelE/StbE
LRHRLSYWYTEVGLGYEIQIKASALKAIKKLERRTRERIVARIVELADNPRPGGCTRLSGPDPFYRVRVGDYRIIYEVMCWSCLC